MLRFCAGLIISLSFSISAFNQSSNLVTGKIVYKRIENGKTDYLEMLFNQQEFRYRLSKTPDFGSYAEFIKIENEIETNDSLSAIQKLEMLQDKVPYASFYRTLSSPARYIFSSKAYKNKTCICDTLNLHTNWELIDGEEEIEGIICGKAQASIENGSKFVAYYAKSIPIAAAPFGLEGLPGLLIKLENISTTKNVWELYDLAWPYTGSTENNLNLCSGYKIINREQEKKEFDLKSRKLKEMKERMDRGERINVKDYLMYFN